MQIVHFLQAHVQALSVLGVALLDFLIEINPNLKSNTLISLALSFFQKQEPPSVPPAPPAA